jgi:hypothetical protein
MMGIWKAFFTLTESRRVLQRRREDDFFVTLEFLPEKEGLFFCRAFSIKAGRHAR